MDSAVLRPIPPLSVNRKVALRLSRHTVVERQLQPGVEDERLRRVGVEGERQRLGLLGRQVERGMLLVVERQVMELVELLPQVSLVFFFNS